MNLNNCLLIENQYFPVVNWFKYSFQKKYILLPLYESYQKMSFRNRTIICGSTGLIHLSVPIEKGRNQKTSFKEVKIAYRENWQISHWRSIVSCYGKSPFFSYYQYELQKFFEKKHVFLFDQNLEIVEWLKNILKMPVEIIVDDGSLRAENNLECDNMTNRWLPKSFREEGDAIKYVQVFEDRIGFQPNLSILDLLFNVGPGASALLNNQ